METKKNTPFPYIAGGLFAFLALMQLAGFYLSVLYILWLAAYVLLAAALFLKRRDILLTLGFGLMALLMLYNFFMGFTPGYPWYRVDSWDSGSHFNLLCVLPYLVELAGYLGAVFLTLALTDTLPKYRETAKKLWFVPAACVLGFFLSAIVVQLLLRIAGSGYWYGSPLNFRSLFHIILVAGAMGCTGLWLAYPEGMPSKIQAAAGGASAAASAAASAVNSAAGTVASAVSDGANGNGFIAMTQHILLLLLTCGIWLYIWIYRTTEYLNRVEDEPPQTPVNQLLLCLFVPFYFIYWFYQNSRRVDKLAVRNGIPSDISTLCLILAIFVPIIPPILMQDKINAIATGGGTGSYTAPQQPVQSRQAPVSRPVVGGIGAAEELKAYKELLDSGAITQEEFEAKKRQLLGL